MTISKTNIEAWEFDGKVYKTLAAAKRAEKKSNLIKQENYLKENATGFHHLAELMVEKANEFWDLGVELVGVGGVVCHYNTYHCLITGQIVLKWGEGEKTSSELNRALICHWNNPKNQGFRHLSSTNHCKTRVGDDLLYTLRIRIDADDFPLIHKKLDKLNEEVSAIKRWKDEREIVNREADIYFYRHSKVNELSEIRKHLQSQIHAIDTLLRNFQTSVIKNYTQKWEDISPCPTLSPDTIKDFGELKAD